MSGSSIPGFYESEGESFRLMFYSDGTSSVARGGHWPEKYAKSHVFGAFEAEFCPIMKTAPPKGYGSRSCKGVAVLRTEEFLKFENSAEKSVLISVKTFFCRSPVFGRKEPFNLRFRPNNPSQFRFQFSQPSTNAPP